MIFTPASNNFNEKFEKRGVIKYKLVTFDSNRIPLGKLFKYNEKYLSPSIAPQYLLITNISRAGSINLPWYTRCLSTINFTSMDARGCQLRIRIVNIFHGDARLQIQRFQKISICYSLVVGQREIILTLHDDK